MGCGGGGSQLRIAPQAVRVSLAVVQHRRDICRQCDQATRNPDRTNRTTKGLTSKSYCRRMRARGKDGNIKLGTQLPHSHCPQGKWPAVGPRPETLTAAPIIAAAPDRTALEAGSIVI